jgi:hypothetical protein
MADLNAEEKANATAVLYSGDSSSERIPIEKPHGILARLRYYEDALDRKIGIESHGVTRVLPEDRDPSYSKWSNQAIMALMWASATMNLSCFTTGFLGWELGLDLWRSIVVLFFGTLLGAMVTVRPP